MQYRSTRERLTALAEDQWGLITRRQAEHAGVPKTTLERLTAGGSLLERVGSGVYRLIGSPAPDHLDLRAAWLQLAPDRPAWERTSGEGVVSHRSAAALYGLGHLPADRHEFTVPTRRQSRRPDVRLHTTRLTAGECRQLRGLWVTRPSRIASDLLRDGEEPDAVARMIADALRSACKEPGTFADSLAPHAPRFGLRRGDGIALLRWFLDIAGDRDTARWMDEARAHAVRAGSKGAEPAEAPTAKPSS
jgi:hypothetical protein